MGIDGMGIDCMGMEDGQVGRGVIGETPLGRLGHMLGQAGAQMGAGQAGAGQVAAWQHCEASWVKGQQPQGPVQPQSGQQCNIQGSSGPPHNTPTPPPV
jgi:hypothetical protein